LKLQKKYFWEIFKLKSKEDFVEIEISRLENDWSMTVATASITAEKWFSARELSGSGDTWDAIVHSIVSLEMPKHKGIYSTSEANDVLIVHKDLKILKKLAKLIKKYANKRPLLEKAIENADPDLLY